MNRCEAEINGLEGRYQCPKNSVVEMHVGNSVPLHLCRQHLWAYETLGGIRRFKGDS